MIPGLLAQDVAQSLREFIVTGFETDTWAFKGKFDDLVNSHNNGEAFIKGPYISISLPFLKNTNERDFFKGFETEHSPFSHQQTSWERLQSDLSPKSTIIATGTGSGKTECFLYPLLDHCQRHSSIKAKSGIKAIVIYPMNALAGDQAKRFASVIHETPELKGKVRVGLFVGGAEVTDQKQMGPEQVITCKKTLRQSPPDILLTNYKMLDYLLMRPKDQPLWKYNDAQTLKYLVVDELHTFDGAQGSDLAMLIRRLKARLSVKTENLVCVGTSATLGSGLQLDDLANYASDIFDTEFNQNSIIGESRQSRENFFNKKEYILLDPSFTPEELLPDYYQSLDDYLVAQTTLFFMAESTIDPTSMQGRQKLGQSLCSHLLLHELLCVSCRGPVTLAELVSAIEKLLPSKLKAHAAQVFISLLSLLSHARGNKYPGEPFVTVRTQLWARELRRIVSRVGRNTAQHPVYLQFFDDLKAGTSEFYLPVVQCSECHTTAWLSCVEQGESHVEQDLQTIYMRFFAKDSRIRVFLPLESAGEYPATSGQVKYLCADCGNLQIKDGQCQSCFEESLVPVFQPDLNKRVKRGGVPVLESQRQCPVCQATSSLLVFGARAASLSAVAIHQMYANPINDDKKLIAFSDSVQDAAHRAGFFSARTWQNNIRMAIAKATAHYAQVEHKAIPLCDLFIYLQHYWLEDINNPDRMEPLNYITQFIAPNMQTFGDYIELQRNNKLEKPRNLIDQIQRRLRWEILSEFGIRSLTGRSLERTGVATLGWDVALIEKAADILREQCSEKLGKPLSKKQSEQMLWGVALRMKRKGAIFDPLLQGYIENGGDWYLLSRKNLSFMPDLGGYSILPKFPGEVSEKGLDRMLPNQQSNWYSRWVTQLIGMSLVDNHFVVDFLPIIMKALVDSGLVLHFTTKKEHDVWGLNPDVLFVTTDLAAIRLQHESKSSRNDEALEIYGSWFIPAIWQDHLVGLPSMDQITHKNKREVAYSIDAYPRRSMYKKFYLHGKINRVIGHEHTALLERDYREALEIRFIAKTADRKPWYENLLSATPTLEMGIDIGDLSSVLLCSVPPNQANYLQRAGRGGRKDGNSFVLTLANGHPHDLYFYADPLKMLAGDVLAPAIFLNASMVLRRQLLAFCFDQWGIVLDGKQVIPGKMQFVLDAVDKRNQNKFPYTLLGFISTHRDELWEGFNQLLGVKVSEQTRHRLKEFMLATSTEDDALHIHVLNRIQILVDERKRLDKQLRDLASELNLLRKKPKDDARDNFEKELETELEGIKRLKWFLNKKETLNFFTDDGLLPNYAFPEEGTTLHSVIYRRLSKPKELEDGKTTNYDSVVYEYSRPARSALSELAPDSVFYASNRKVKIDRVEMAKGENLESWRLCPNCSYSEQILGADQDVTCPRCKDPMWANISQLMPMVRLRQVYATTKDENAFIGDDSDTRDPIFFNRQLLVDFEVSDIAFAYAMKTETKPFGFEFIKKVNFKEVNFGKKGGNDQIIDVAGKELSRPGFRLCKECGMVQHSVNKPEHLYKCQFRQNTTKDSERNDTGIVECLYLYREYQSEAIRILMPRFSVADHEEQVQSFVAAIQLGLKARYGGKVDHLQITTHDEPIPGSTERASYLVIYDTVPGGTGYLHELLTNPDHFMTLLTKSRDIMADCSCQEIADVDGCYNCLYAYRNSYGMESTSRKTALAMLEGILDENIELESVPSLGKIVKDPWADSELESRFPDAIQSLNKHKEFEGVRIRTTKDIINGKVGFKLEVGELLYTIETHPRLDESHGVAYPCEPDFLITLDKASDGVPAVAVFLDGYRFHKHIVHEDLMKRQGIFLSTNMLTWSLTWPDINHTFAGNEVKIPNVFRENTADSPKSYIRGIAEKKDLLDHSRIAELTPLMMLFKFLSKPDVDMWKGYSALRVLSWLDQRTMSDKLSLDKFQESAGDWPSQFVDRFSGVKFIFSTSHSINDKSVRLNTYIAGSEHVVKTLNVEELFFATVFQIVDPEAEIAQRTWQKLLQIVNLGQFLPNFFAGTESGIEDGSFSRLSWGVKSGKVEVSKWDKVFDLADDELEDLLNLLSSEGIYTPVVGFELVDKNGAAAAEAVLAWEDKKIAYLMEYQIEESLAEFEKYGWFVITENSDIDVILSKLKG